MNRFSGQLHVTVDCRDDPEAGELVGLASSKCALVRRLLRLEHGELTAAWSELRSSRGADEAVALLEVASSRTADGWRELAMARDEEATHVERIVRSADALGYEPGELGRYLTEREGEGVRG